MALRNRKGTTESLSALIGIIVFLLIFVPVGIAFYHYISSQSNMEKTLNLLVKRTSSLQDGEKGAIVGSIEDGYLLMGFQKNANDFGGEGAWSCGEGFWSSYWMLWNVRKPGICKDKACLCACEFLGVWGTEPLLEASACEEGICVPYEAGFDPIMHGGPACEFGPWIDTEDSPVVEIHYEKKGDIIGICEHEDCVSSDLDKARKVFADFYKSYMECKGYNSNDCICGKAYVEEMPMRYEIALDTNGEKTTIKLIDTQSKTMGTRLVEPDYFGVYNPSTDEAREKSSLHIISFLPSINPASAAEGKPVGTKLPVVLFKAKGGFVSMVQGTLEDVVSKGKGYCAAEVKAENCRFKEGDSSLSGLCVDTSCDMLFWAQREAIMPDGNCSKANYVCCEEKSPCESVGGMCKASCGQDEIKIIHQNYGDMACQLDNEVCCAPAGTTFPDKNPCEANFGVCRQGLCRIDTEYRNADYECSDSGQSCCMVQGQLSEYAVALADAEMSKKAASAAPIPEPEAEPLITEQE